MSKPTYQIIWANLPGEALPENYLRFFPDIGKPNGRLEAKDIHFLLEQLSPLYRTLIDLIARFYSKQTGLDERALQVVLREPVVLVVYAFMDRLLRYSKLISANGADICLLRTVQVHAPVWPQTEIHLITLLNQSQQFGQYFLMRIGEIFGIASIEVRSVKVANCESTVGVKNHTFDSPSFPRRIKRKLVRTCSSLIGGLPALRLANLESYLLDRGLYGPRKLAWLASDTPIIRAIRGNKTREEGLRSRLAVEIQGEAEESYLATLSDCGLGDSAHLANGGLRCLAELLTSLIPIERFEEAGVYQDCMHRLGRFNQRGLVICGMPAGPEIFWVAAAKAARIPVIGVQHGAHYGFCEHSNFIELEYAYCDKFVTWGWRKMPDHSLACNVETIALPSPWLSMRKLQWRDLPALSQGQRYERPYDVLLMTDRLHVFPPTLTTLRMSRHDFFDEITSRMSSIVDGLIGQGVRVLHKPFNDTTRKIQIDLHDTLVVKHPGIYAIVQELDKGLTQALLRQAWVVVWDEPGTGFFECLVSGIPTLLYWDRLTTFEAPHVRGIFAKLEDVGLVHKAHGTLVQAATSMLEAPEKWFANMERSSAISEALAIFADTNPYWHLAWKTGLKQW